jgi:hypothetical protein
MSLFNLYPKVSFSVNDFDKIKAIDITATLKIRDFIRTFRGINYQPYLVKDGERPDNVAYKVYGDPKLDWLILMANDIHNIYDEWPKSSEQFREYIVDKYGSIAAATSVTKYYYDKYRNIIDESTHNSLSASEQGPIETVYQWEERMNTNKAKIKIVSPALAGAIQSEVKSLLINPVR